MIEFLGGKTSAVRCPKKPRLRLESNKALGGFFSPGARELERKRERERKREKERGERETLFKRKEEDIVCLAKTHRSLRLSVKCLRKRRRRRKKRKLY
jgi:hypothetical protein